jgi:hypothetical protein
MSTEVIQKVHDIVAQEPHSGQALMLFALVKTLDIEQGNHMYTLGKLKDFSAENRQLAYQLMEMMATGQTGDEEWNRLLASMENIIRGDQ